ncbi:MAG: hypothetical protein ASARMPREDX12_003355 [Alectoria sarmentosa]|nr:MAG: hypothetical protein ASARMPREDX12_003355 [Alectoria sarmentosa]
MDLCQVPASPLGEKQASNVTFIRGDFRKFSGTDPHLRFGSADFVFETLKPGAWVEMGDYIEDVSFSDNRAVNPREDWEWLRAIRAGGKRQGLDLDAGRNHAGYMGQVGFVDVQGGEYKVPYWMGAEKDLPGSKKMTEHVIGDK